jgi:hypothetical protein
MDAAERLFPNTPAGLLLRDYWRQEESLTTGDEARERYQRSIERLRGVADEAALLLYDAYQALADGDTLDQFQAAMTLRDLEDDAALAPLETIARSPISVPDNDDEQDAQLVHERSVHMTAISGLAKLAAHGSEEARQILLELAGDPTFEEHRSIKVRAIRGYIGRDEGSAERAAQIAAEVPADLAWTLEPQADPATIYADTAFQAELAAK